MAQPENRAADSDTRAFQTFLPPAAPGLDSAGPYLSHNPVSSPFPAPPNAGGAGPSMPSMGPGTTELEVVRGRRAARPQTPRRRGEAVLGRVVSHRRVWGGAVALALILVVPGAAMLPKTVNIADGALTGEGANQAAIKDTPDATQSAEPDPTGTMTTAGALAKAPAAAAAAAAAVSADGTGKAKGKAKNTTRKTAKLPTSGSTGRLNDSESGLGWVSGLFPGRKGVEGVKAFGEWRGAPVDVIVDWSARQTWDELAKPVWTFDQYKGTPYTKVFSIAPIPDGDTSATMDGCAAGDYNDKWVEFGRLIKAAGIDDETVIRLGWEFNISGTRWATGDANQFIQCWKQIVSSAESTAPALLWDWNVNIGKGSAMPDARDAYPGDDWVDIVGVDSYDMWPPVTDEASWASHYSGAYGLKFWSDFARDHGKRLSIPEWGVYPNNAESSGGDNPYYIEKMHGFFKEEGAHLAYESYFNENDGYYAGSLHAPEQNPAAAAQYLRDLAR